jgi:hypothetical protein
LFFGYLVKKEFGNSGTRTQAQKKKEEKKKERKKEVHQNKKAQATFQLFYFLFLVPRLPSCSQVFTKKSDIIAYTHKEIDTEKLYTRKTKQASLLSFLYSPLFFFCMSFATIRVANLLVRRFSFHDCNELAVCEIDLCRMRERERDQALK